MKQGEWQQRAIQEPRSGNRTDAKVDCRSDATSCLNPTPSTTNAIAGVNSAIKKKNDYGTSLIPVSLLS